MGEEGFFKTAAFGGFDKKSVLNYIDSLNEKFHTAEADFNNKLAEYDKAQASQLAHIKRLEGKLAEQNDKLTAVAEELERERTTSRQSQELLGELDKQNKALQKQLSDGERELQIQIERGRQLQFKSESLDYKSRKYDELSSQIGDAMLEAKRNADTIVAEANHKADEITAQAHGYMHHFYTELASFKGDAGRLRKSIEEILFVLNDRIDVMQDVIRQVETRFEADPALCYSEEPETDEIPPAQTPAED